MQRFMHLIAAAISKRVREAALNSERANLAAT